MFKKHQIWKLQRPLASNEESPLVMAYTKKKTSMAMMPMPNEMVEEIFGEELKIYVKARIVNGILKVKRRVEDQEW